MDINVRSSLPNSQFGNESIETWLRDIYRRLEDLERRPVAGRVTGSPSSGGGVSPSLPFVTIGNTPHLTAERSLIEGSYINITDGGPNTSVSVAVDIDAVDTHSGGLFLKLDASNDPLTGDLDVQVNAEHALRVLDDTIVATDADELWLFESSGIYYTSNYADASPTWSKVAGAMPDSATLSRGFISKDGTTVYLIYSQNANKGIYKCSNPKAATPIWTDILAGQASGIYPYRVDDANWDCGISGNTLWVFARATGEDLFYGYHLGEYNGSTWVWSGANWNTGDYRLSYSSYNGKSRYVSTSDTSTYTVDTQALISSPSGYHCAQSARWQLWDFSASLTAMLVKTNDGTKTYLYIPNADTVLTEITGTYAGFNAGGLVNGSLEGNRVFVINTGASLGDIYIGDTTGVVLKANWTYAQRIHDTKLAGGGSLIATVSQCASGGEVARISADGGDTWSDITGNFWTLTSGGKTFYNSGMTYTAGSNTTMFNVDTLTGDTDVVRLIASQTVQGTRFLSTVATGTSPLSIVSTTLNTNLNADLLDGSHASAFVPITRTIGTTAPLSGGGDLSANRTLSISQAATASDGYLSSTDWNTFNNKQPAGNYITALTGDVTATGPGSAAATLATVNSNVGSFTNASITVNAKGLITAVSSGATPVTGSGSAGQIAYWSGTSAITGENELFWDAANNRLGIGTASPSYALDAIAAGSGAIRLSENATNATTKFGRFVTRHYTNAEEDFIGFNITSTAAAGIVQFGGGSSIYNTATLIQFYTAANNTTLTGTERMSIDSAGYGRFFGDYTANRVGVGSIFTQASPATIASPLHVSVSTAGSWQAVTIQNGNSATNDTADIDFRMTSAAVTTGRIGAARVGASAITDLVFHTYNGTLQERMRIDNVGLTTIKANNATTNAADAVLTLGHNSTGTPAQLFGLRTSYTLESSTTADQVAGYDDRLWTDQTHASRTVLYRGTTTGNATQTGFYGAWAHNAVSNTAITIIPNGTGDVTSVGTFVFTVKDNTSSTTNGGIVVVNPGGGAISLLSDGTDTLQVTCAADGSLSIARSAGTHTFSVSLWGCWQ